MQPYRWKERRLKVSSSSRGPRAEEEEMADGSRMISREGRGNRCSAGGRITSRLRGMSHQKPRNRKARKIRGLVRESRGTTNLCIDQRILLLLTLRINKPKSLPRSSRNQNTGRSNKPQSNRKKAKLLAASLVLGNKPLWSINAKMK